MAILTGIKEEINTLRLMLRHRIYISPKTQENVVQSFHRLYYNSNQFGQTFVNTFWLGVPTLKCPLDLWIYQEMIYELKPDLIVETGTAGGGSALFMASIFDMLGKGSILSVDIEPNEKRPAHPRISYFLGSSTAPNIVQQVTQAAQNKKTVLVILDSDHSQHHVREELEAYHKLVTPGSYLVVEDTNVNGHPVFPEHGPGPMEALDGFLKDHDNFQIDASKEKFYLTFNPRGFLKKIK